MSLLFHIYVYVYGVSFCILLSQNRFYYDFGFDFVHWTILSGGGSDRNAILLVKWLVNDGKAHFVTATREKKARSISLLILVFTLTWSADIYPK